MPIGLSSPGPQLSVCIATYNRGRFIGETLASLVRQADSRVEIVVVDGASPDDTQAAVAPFLTQSANVRYYREATNSGVDGDYDKAVGYATGDYCWLFPDDDLATPNAIARVLKYLAQTPDLIVANSRIWNTDFSTDLHTTMLPFTADRTYQAGDRETVFTELATCLSFIGSVVVKRSTWLARDRASYYGTLYAHVGVIFQHPPLERVAVIAEPLIQIRYGNSMWTPRSFEVLYFKWPRLVWSFRDFDEGLKRRVVAREPWRRWRSLFKSRASGEYTRTHYHKYLASRSWDRDRLVASVVSVFPGKPANLAWVMYYCLFQRSALFTLFDLLTCRNSSVLSRSVARLLGIKVA